MKRIVYISLFAIITLISFSCSSTYYYATLNAFNEDVEKVENGDFLYENDSLWIAHCFKGKDAPILVTVYNKLDVPLYVDWNKSALVINDEAFTYSGKKATLTGEGSTRGSSYPTLSGERVNFSDLEFSGDIDMPQQVSFIPPGSKTSYETIRVGARFDKIKDEEYTKVKVNSVNGQAHSVRKKVYDTEDTPLVFTSYITSYTNPEKPDLRSFHFYVKNVMKTGIRPNNLPGRMADRGDTFYQEREADNTGWYVVGTVAAAAAFVGILIAVDPEVDTYIEDYDY